MHLLSVFSLRNRALIALVTIVIGVFGGIALTSLKQELIPSVTFPQLVIVTSYPGAAPVVVENDVSTPIEAAIQGIAGIKDTSATSSASSSSVSASFVYGTDLIFAEQKVDQALGRIKSTLPTGVDPIVIAGSIDDLPVIQVAVTSNLSPNDLSNALSSSTITDIQGLDGVRAATLTGTAGQRVTITPDTAKLLAAGLTNQSLRDALNANGALLPTGSITENGQTLIVQSGVRLASAADIAALPLVGARSSTNSAVTVSSVADVAVVENPVSSVSRVNGKDALTIGITKTPAGNTVAVSHAVRDLLPTLEKAIGSNTTMTAVFDQAPYIEQSIDSLATEGLLGLGFAVLIILVFLLSVRSTLVTAISIPVSVLITFIGMLASGYTLNIITLGALTIAIGRVVDDSIVVIENIKRHLTLGEEKLTAIGSAVREVAAAITASTVTTVAVFLPIALVQGITGELFRPFALTVTIALGASLFVALTIVPVLAFWFLKTPAPHKHGAADPQPMSNAGDARVVIDRAERPTRLQRAYLPVLRGTLRRPVLTIVSAGLVLGITAALVPILKTNFIGDSGQNTLTIAQTLTRSASLEARSNAAKAVETAVLKVQGVDTVQLSIGAAGNSVLTAFNAGGGESTFSVTTDPTVDQQSVRSGVLTAIASVKNAGTVTIANARAAFASTSIDVNVTADSADTLTKAAESVVTAVKKLSQVASASSDISQTQPYIGIRVDRAKAAKAGLTEVAVGGIVANSMLPAAVGSVVIDDKTLSIYIRDPGAPTTIDALQKFTIPTATGPVPLSRLADVATFIGPASITTIKGRQAATISITPHGDDVGTASSAVSNAVERLTLPQGASASIGGVASDQSDAFGQLGLALLAAILIVYVVMVATFKSLRQPLLLLVSVPFAATGAIILQVLSDIPLGVPSLIGVLMLIGIVVTNAIVLIDLVNQYRDRGLKVGEAILQGASRRVRPILMTAAATIFALVPLATGLTGSGGFISQPLAIIVIGGLVSSTVLTLVVLPTLYYLVEGARERRLDRVASRFS